MTTLCNRKIAKYSGNLIFTTLVSLIIFTLLLFISPVFAQKIKVIKHKKRNYPERTVILDTLNISIKIKRLEIKELQYYSIIYFSNIPPDLTVLLNSSGYNMNINSEENFYVFYNLKPSDYYYLANSYNFQDFQLGSGYMNPFLQPNGQKKYHVFQLEILNKNPVTIKLNPDLIAAVSRNLVNKSILTLVDFFAPNSQGENSIENKKMNNYLKILEDNLFQDKVILPRKTVSGLICFPMNRIGENISKIIIPGVEFYLKQRFDLTIVL